MSRGSQFRRSFYTRKHDVERTESRPRQLMERLLFGLGRVTSDKIIAYFSYFFADMYVTRQGKARRIMALSLIFVVSTIYHMLPISSNLHFSCHLS